MNNIKTNLQEAEAKALQLFDEIEKQGLIRAGKTETELNNEVFELAFSLFGIEKYWHKRIVRSGKNTLAPYNETPPDLIIEDDDILFFDFGPIFEEWEADFGRTYVIGDNPIKIKLKNDIESAWYEAQQWYRDQSMVTGAQLYNYAIALAKKYNWTFGGEIAGHIIGHFPHERLEKENKDNYVHPANHRNMREPSMNGQAREWILEIHFVDKDLEIGGFFEQLI